MLRPQTSQYVGCRPYCWPSPRSLITMAALVWHIRSFRSAIVFSSRTVGYGGWSWWQKTPWTTTPGKVAFPRSCRFPSAKHPNGFSPFLYLSKYFYTRLKLLLGLRYGSDKLGVPTWDYCFLISAILGVIGRLLPTWVWLPVVRSWPLFWPRDTREFLNCIFFCLYQYESG